MQPFRMIIGLAVAGILFWSPLTLCAQNQHPVVSPGEVFHLFSTRNELTLTERFSRVIELDKRIARVDGFDPAVLTVSALSPHQVRVQAANAGVTTLVLVDENDKTYSIEVFVEGDVRHLQSYISRLFPDSSVKAVKVRDSVILRGVVADPSHITQITEVAEQFYPKVINQMSFGAATQVRLQVRIMEAQRSKIRQLGFNWSLLTNSGYISSNTGNLGTPNGVTLTPGGPNLLGYGANGLADSAISFGMVNGNNIFRGFLEALKQEGLLRVLVETSVVADSGHPASLLSGGEFPILVPQALGTLSVEWREFGVKLEAVPIVLGQGQVLLEIAPEFSERDFANAATLNNTTIPAITTRRANTQVRMKMGQTLMIGGLIATRYTAETDKLPILGELPYIGAAFRRVRYDENETELIILVTPEYAAPLNPDQVPQGGPGMFTDIPTDRELYMQGLIEVPNYGGPIPPTQIHPHGPTHHLPFEQYTPAPTPVMPPVKKEILLPPKEHSSQYIPKNNSQFGSSKGTETIPLLPAPVKVKELQTLPALPAPPVKTSKKSNKGENEITSINGWHQPANDSRKHFALSKGVVQTPKKELADFSWATQDGPFSSGPPSLIMPTKRKEEKTVPEKQ